MLNVNQPFATLRIQKSAKSYAFFWFLTSLQRCWTQYAQQFHELMTITLQPGGCEFFFEFSFKLKLVVQICRWKEIPVNYELFYRNRVSWLLTNNRLRILLEKTFRTTTYFVKRSDALSIIYIIMSRLIWMTIIQMNF